MDTRAHAATARPSNALRDLLTVIAILGIGFCDGAAAEVLEEVVVTAQRREQNLQDVGISVSALGGSAVKALGMRTTSDLTAHMPNVQMFDAVGGPGMNVSLAIRGVGLNDFQDGTEAPSVVYVDEFYVLPLAAASVAIYDLERVEALRGPQGTLFGRNATGGLIHFITRKPDLTALGGYFDVTLGEHQQMNVEAALNVPITESVATRLSVVSLNNDGWQENVLGVEPDGGATEWWAARNQWLWNATDDLEVLAKVEFSRAEGDTGYYQNQPSFPDADDNGDSKVLPSDMVNPFFPTCAGCDFLGFREDQVGAGTAFDDRVVADLPHGLDANEVLNATIRLKWGLGAAELTSITGFLSVDKHNFEDCYNGVQDVCVADYNYNQDEFTQELRLAGEADRLQWTTGLYYLHQKADNKQWVALDYAGALGFTGIPGVPFVVDSQWESETDAWAVFGQVEYALSPKWSVIGGLRYSRDDKTFEEVVKNYIADDSNLVLPGGTLRSNNFLPDPAFPFFGGINFTRNGPAFGIDLDGDGIGETPAEPAGGLVDQDFSDVNAKLELDWRPNDDLLIYTSLSRGTKSGGYNNGFIGGLEVGSSNAAVPFDPEVLHALEVGFKSTFWNGRARLNGSTFYYDYNDYQAFKFVGFAAITGNNDARSYGGELELVVNPIDGLDLALGMSLLDTKVEDLAGLNPWTGEPVVRDREMGLAPDVTVNGIARYEWELFGGYAALQGDFNYVGDRFTDVQNKPVQTLDSYFIGNARAAWRTSDDRWEAALFVKNIGDELPAAFIFDLTTTFGMAQVNVTQVPRWFGATLSYRY